MAGHSKFKNIQFRKGAQDKKRSKLFSKLAREITAAAKMGLPDPAMNARLRGAVQTARAQNMPRDNIERAIKKSAEAGGANYEEVRYEGFGTGGVGVIVETLTLSASSNAAASSSMLLRLAPGMISVSVRPRASMQVLHSRTCPLPANTRFNMRSML